MPAACRALIALNWIVVGVAVVTAFYVNPTIYRMTLDHLAWERRADVAPGNDRVQVWPEYDVNRDKLDRYREELRPLASSGSLGWLLLAVLGAVNALALRSFRRHVAPKV